VSLNVRAFAEGDRAGIWAILEPVIRAGETYALPRDQSEAEAHATWCAPEHEVLVAEDTGRLLGAAYLKANQRGGGAHVANAAFATSEAARGRGVGRALCEAAMERARARGFRAMQFNFVVASNEGAVRLWRSLGFTEVGRLPDAFHHPRLGFVDALVMHRVL